MTTKTRIIGLFALFSVLILSGFGCSKKQEISLDKTPPKQQEKFFPFTPPKDASPITGQSCANYDKRPFAVMYSGSLDARQYWHNLSKAEFVLEMPHRPMHGEPRLLGVFQCELPDAVGPMRSGRVDHISVADSLGAVFVTWGKSSIAGAVLRKGWVDNIEVGNGTRSSDGTRAGYLKPDVPITSAYPAFGDLRGVLKIAHEKGFDSSNRFEGFPHQGDAPRNQRPDHAKVTVKFEGKNRVYYEYDPETNSYKRFSRSGKPAIDYATKEQYAPKNIITIITKKDSWYTDKNYVAEGLRDPWEGVDAGHRQRDNGQYPNMQLGDPWFDTKYEGEARFFFNGQEIKGTWKRTKGANERFHFFDADGEEIRFVPGQIWMEVLGHGRSVSYEDEQEYQERLTKEAKEKIVTSTSS